MERRDYASLFDRGYAHAPRDAHFGISIGVNFDQIAYLHESRRTYRSI
jgi:hypothetical protein